MLAKHHVKMVIGTTGFSPEQKLAIEAASKNISIVFAPNMSVVYVLTHRIATDAGKSTVSRQGPRVGYRKVGSSCFILKALPFS